MLNVGPAEFLIIGLVLLIAVGPEQLPGVIRRVGHTVAQLRSMTDGLRSEFMAGLDDMERAADPSKWASSDGGGGSSDGAAGSSTRRTRSSTSPNGDIAPTEAATQSEDVSDTPTEASTQPEDVSDTPTEAADRSEDVSDTPTEAADRSEEASVEPPTNPDELDREGDR